MYDHLKRCAGWYDTFMYIIIFFMWNIFFHQNPILKSMQLDFKVLWYIIPQVRYLKSKILLSKPEAEFKELHILFLKGKKKHDCKWPSKQKEQYLINNSTLDQVWIIYQCFVCFNCLFSLAGFLQKWLARIFCFWESQWKNSRN